MHGHGGGATTEDAYHMVLHSLDGFLGHDVAVIIGGNELVRHRSEFDLVFVCG